MAKKPLEFFPFYLWGPTPNASTEGYRYYIIFVDAYTRYKWFYPLKLKSDALSTFIAFPKFTELQYHSKIKAL